MFEITYCLSFREDSLPTTNVNYAYYSLHDGRIVLHQRIKYVDTILGAY
jgi:hypothetical protein